MEWQELLAHNALPEVQVKAAQIIGGLLLSLAVIYGGFNLVLFLAGFVRGS